MKLTKEQRAEVRDYLLSSVDLHDLIEMYIDHISDQEKANLLDDVLDAHSITGDYPHIAKQVEERTQEVTAYEWHNGATYDLRTMTAHLDDDHWGIGRGRDYLRGNEPPRYPVPAIPAQIAYDQASDDQIISLGVEELIPWSWSRESGYAHQDWCRRITFIRSY